MSLQKMTNESKTTRNDLKFRKTHRQSHKNYELFPEDKLHFYMALFCCK